MATIRAAITATALLGLGIYMLAHQQHKLDALKAKHQCVNTINHKPC